MLKQSSPKWACGWVVRWRSAAELRAARPLGCSLLLRNSLEVDVLAARSCFATRGVDVLAGSLLLCKSRGVDGLAGAVGSCGAMCARWLSVWVLVLGLLGQARADSASSMPSALASGVPCGLLGDCARFDAPFRSVRRAPRRRQSDCDLVVAPGDTRKSTVHIEFCGASGGFATKLKMIVDGQISECAHPNSCVAKGGPEYNFFITSTEYAGFLSELASHGYFIIAVGRDDQPFDMGRV